ncbi:hypothetical protein Nepgr_006814 [Nepenthes gracilis]|uniref:Uncharacterized protein n=1 Tax=Nepenthes gracilis TaxID=150966 RepID=A0AAD3S624_NEPGR|nr:hypothetical protein Nepgr_006814 [Nepenthes gracilis]
MLKTFADALPVMVYQSFWAGQVLLGGCLRWIFLHSAPLQGADGAEAGSDCTASDLPRLNFVTLEGQMPSFFGGFGLSWQVECCHRGCLGD